MKTNNSIAIILSILTIFLSNLSVEAQEATPAPIPVKTAVILDDGDSDVDITGQVDYDAPWDAKIAIQWEYDPSDSEIQVKQFHIYAYYNSGKSKKFLEVYDQSDESTLYTHVWEGNADSQLNNSIFNVAYQIKIFAIYESFQHFLYAETGEITLALDETAYNKEFPPGSTIILDDVNSEEDITDGIDYDASWERQLVIQWEIDQYNPDIKIAQYNVYAESPSLGNSIYIGYGVQMDDPTKFRNVWCGGRIYSPYAFISPPDFDITYKFKIYIQFENGIQVLYAQTGEITLALDDSAYNSESPPGIMYITDDENSVEDLQGSIDYDAPENRKIVFHFKPDPLNFYYWDIRGFIIRVFEESSPTHQMYITSFACSKFDPDTIYSVIYKPLACLDANVLDDILNEGPQFGKKYGFRVYCCLFAI